MVVFRIVLRSVLILSGLLVVLLSAAMTMVLVTGLGSPIVTLIAGIVCALGVLHYLAILWLRPREQTRVTPELASLLGAGVLSRLVARRFALR
jgi:multisubunit Na+/H+ antiporter MnhB subunit